MSYNSIMPEFYSAKQPYTPMWLMKYSGKQLKIKTKSFLCVPNTFLIAFAAQTNFFCKRGYYAEKLDFINEFRYNVTTYQHINVASDLIEKNYFLRQSII